MRYHVLIFNLGGLFWKGTEEFLVFGLQPSLPFTCTFNTKKNFTSVITIKVHSRNITRSIKGLANDSSQAKSAKRRRSLSAISMFKESEHHKRQYAPLKTHQEQEQEQEYKEDYETLVSRRMSGQSSFGTHTSRSNITGGGLISYSEAFLYVSI